MPRGPRYRPGQFKHVTKDMYWDADQKREEDAEVQRRLEEITVYRVRQDQIAEEQRRKRNEAEQRKRAERLRIFTCPFCESHDRDHTCEVFAKMQAEFSARMKSRGIQSNVPYEWVVEQFTKKGKTPPTREQFDQHNYDYPP